MSRNSVNSIEFAIGLFNVRVEENSIDNGNSKE